ncbi:hypothetical protein CF651_07490 [Paenibacillus rigui]|uniref:Uncharacterized protein n=1 Tax=Paenibacillus rigui TaxID=554312 RepID=A0A229UTM7_9BACL|nr:hypothetical protein CF651_07490 [Paenibacillus rigui]
MNKIASLQSCRQLDFESGSFAAFTLKRNKGIGHKREDLACEGNISENIVELRRDLSKKVELMGLY